MAQGAGAAGDGRGVGRSLRRARRWRAQAQQTPTRLRWPISIVAEQRIAKWDGERQAQADAEALVIEAERLAAATSIDNANLPQRWQALDRAIRTPALTRRFEAALMVVEQRRLAQIRAAQQEASAARQRVHDLLHTAEQALAAGQLQAARAAADEIRTHKAGAGPLPKPTTQRLGRVVQQLTELERWESFGQQNARIQLCERAEALATQALDAAQIAQEVQKLRNEWKALDQQHAGVPKALWERFDRACEKAYAPAARHFAELAAQRKEARKQREEFIAAAAAHAPTLVTETPDWRAIERWLRETDHAWREGELGSVDPGAWKKLDAKLKAALARCATRLSAARDKAKAGRQALIDEAVALGAKAMDRDAPSQVKAIQARWQEQAKALSLAQRDERALWEQFRAACDAVFNARDAKRKEEDGRKHESRRALDDLCAEMEQLAAARTRASRTSSGRRASCRTSGRSWPASSIRRCGRRIAFQERPDGRGGDADRPRAFARSGRLADVGGQGAPVRATRQPRARGCRRGRIRRGRIADTGTVAGVARDAAGMGTENGGPPRCRGESMAAPESVAAHVARIESGTAARSDALLELEMALGLESPAEFQAQRLALQVRQLRDRFQSTGTASPAPPPTGWSRGVRSLEWPIPATGSGCSASLRRWRNCADRLAARSLSAAIGSERRNAPPQCAA